MDRNDGKSFWDREEGEFQIRSGNNGITRSGGQSRRPIRDAIESVTDRVPEGPLDKVGEGDLVGLGGFLAVESTRPLIQIIPGVKQPGYNVTAHSTSIVNGVERHELTVTAFSEDVAEFVAGYTATPSNIDFLSTDVNLVNTEVVTERSTYSTYKVTVDLEK